MFIVVLYFLIQLKIFDSKFVRINLLLSFLGYLLLNIFHLILRWFSLWHDWRLVPVIVKLKILYFFCCCEGQFTKFVIIFIGIFVQKCHWIYIFLLFRLCADLLLLILQLHLLLKLIILRSLFVIIAEIISFLPHRSRRHRLNSKSIFIIHFYFDEK